MPGMISPEFCVPAHSNMLCKHPMTLLRILRWQQIRLTLSREAINPKC
jgi:hypothetical protein